MNIIAMMVVKNEADRYLKPALDWLQKQVDTIFVFDDDSTDGTYEIAMDYGVVCRRPSMSRSFMEHEGKFRTTALRTLEVVVQPSEDDWVFIADADEFFVPHTETLHDMIDSVQPHIGAIRINIHSVWAQEGERLVHRVDAPWNTLFEPRLWKYRRGLAFADVPMACRNEPVFYTQNYGLVASDVRTGSAILHYGYASLRDRSQRFMRYSALADHGHSNSFIGSIMDMDAVTRPWEGEIPCPIQ